MNKPTKPKEVKGYNVKRELVKADKLFQSIAKDKNLPTFGNFFIQCLILGTGENVNLKAMYPKVYNRITIWLKDHKAKITALAK